MNKEPVKFLPLEHQIRPYEPDLYQQNWDLRMALDLAKEEATKWKWIAFTGPTILIVLLKLLNCL